MVKTYRTVQQWETWLTHFLGMSILETEQAFLADLLADRYGKYALLIGLPTQHELLKSSVIANRIVLSPLVNKNKYIKFIESEFYELPLFSGSLDLVILPHTLEFIDNPHQLLSEACRVVKPEGDIIIFGFNPWSLWGIKKWWVESKNVPWSGNFIPANRVKKWLALADFELIMHKMLLYRPPLRHPLLYQKLKWLDWLAQKCQMPLGNLYVLVAKAKTIPLSPIKLHWKQRLPALSVTIPGPTMRDSR